MSVTEIIKENNFGRSDSDPSLEVRLGDLLQRLCGGLEQDAVDDLAILPGDSRDLLWHREDDVEVLDRQELGLPLLQPFRPCQGLALRAMAVSAGVVGDLSVPALAALGDVTAQGRSAAIDEGP